MFRTSWVNPQGDSCICIVVCLGESVFGSRTRCPIHQTAHTDACKTYRTANTAVSLRMNQRGSKHVGDNRNYMLLSYLLTYLLTYSPTYLLTHCMEQSPSWESNRLVKKFPTFYGTRRFITAFTSAHHLSLSRARSIQSIPHIAIPEDPS